MPKASRGPGSLPGGPGLPAPLRVPASGASPPTGLRSLGLAAVGPWLPPVSEHGRSERLRAVRPPPRVAAPRAHTICMRWWHASSAQLCAQCAFFASRSETLLQLSLQTPHVASMRRGVRRAAIHAVTAAISETVAQAEAATPFSWLHSVHLRPLAAGSRSPHLGGRQSATRSCMCPVGLRDHFEAVLFAPGSGCLSQRKNANAGGTSGDTG